MNIEIKHLPMQIGHCGMSLVLLLLSSVFSVIVIMSLKKDIQTEHILGKQNDIIRLKSICSSLSKESYLASIMFLDSPKRILYLGMFMDLQTLMLKKIQM